MCVFSAPTLLFLYTPSSSKVTALPFKIKMPSHPGSSLQKTRVSSRQILKKNFFYDILLLNIFIVFSFYYYYMESTHGDRILCWSIDVFCPWINLFSHVLWEILYYYCIFDSKSGIWCWLPVECNITEQVRFISLYASTVPTQFKTDKRDKNP